MASVYGLFLIVTTIVPQAGVRWLDVLSFCPFMFGVIALIRWRCRDRPSVAK
jgi:hypothetical protein